MVNRKSSLETAHSSKPLLTVAEAAHQLGLQPSAIRAWLLRREIGFVRVGRRAVRIPFDVVARIIAEGTVPARPRR
jgi:excisionase family DNA binding protein